MEHPTADRYSSNMVTLYVLHGDGTITGEFSVPTLFAALRDPTCTFWLDMLKPTDEEIALLDDVFGFHPLAIEDTITYAQRPKIESYNHIGDAMTTGYFYMVFHGPDLETFRERLRTKELDLFVSARYLVTIHDEEMKSVLTVLNRTRSDPLGMLSRGTDLLLHNIIDHMVDHYEPILDYLDEALDELEERALTDPSPSVLSEIANKKKELLNLRRIVGPQREVIAQLTRGEVPFIRESTRIYLRDVQDHLIRVVEMIELYRDLVLGSRDIYLSSIGNNTNQVMKTLTLISVIGLPFTVITGFFGMNYFDTEGLHRHGAFWVTVFVMFGMVAGLLTFFKMRKWI
jgi:magnesium transporter